MAPMLGDNPGSCNSDMIQIFSVVRDCAANLSMAPGSDKEGPPNRRLLGEALRSVNWMAERIMDRVRAGCMSTWEWTHARPPRDLFKVRPIRFPLRSDFCQDAVFHWLGLMVEMAESNDNAAHSSLTASTGARLLGALLHLKANWMRDWFDLEVEGDISFGEQSALMSGVAMPGPVIVPTGEQMSRPDIESITTALAGTPVFQWFPTEQDWLVFGKKYDELVKMERIWQPEGARMTTEDVAPETAPAHPGGLPAGEPG
ncbi:MAG: hypothetical protein GY856_36955 [bacterium]|nr:hypothetical protein [bacterium]